MMMKVIAAMLAVLGLFGCAITQSDSASPATRTRGKA